MSKNLSVKRTLFTGTLLLTTAGILSRFIGFFYKIFLSRTIGAEGLGIYQLIFPVMALCFSLTSAGIQTSVSRFVSNEIGKSCRSQILSADRTDSICMPVCFYRPFYVESL